MCPVALLADRDVVLRRLRERVAPRQLQRLLGPGLVPKRESFAVARLDQCLAQLQAPMFATHVWTDGLTVPQVAEHVAVLAGLELAPNQRGRLRQGLAQRWISMRTLAATRRRERRTSVTPRSGRGAGEPHPVVLYTCAEPRSPVVEDGAVRAPSLTVAAAQPACHPRDVAANAVAHAEAVRAAQARVVVFPELSLTGYELDASAVEPDDDALLPLVAACTATGSLALVGAPVEQEGRRFIATLVVDRAGARVAYRKRWLGGHEPGRFHPGDGPTVLQVDGWRLGLGICKDTGAAQHVAGIAALDDDAYLAGLVHLPQELPEQEARAVVIARACRAFVVFASFAGSTGDVFTETAGSSAVYSPDGLAVARAGPDPGSIVRAHLG